MLNWIFTVLHKSLADDVVLSCVCESVSNVYSIMQLQMYVQLKVSFRYLEINLKFFLKKKKNIICYYNQHKNRLNKASYWANQPFNEIECLVASKDVSFSKKDRWGRLVFWCIKPVFLNQKTCLFLTCLFVSLGVGEYKNGCFLIHPKDSFKYVMLAWPIASLKMTP